MTDRKAQTLKELQETPPRLPEGSKAIQAPAVHPVTVRWSGETLALLETLEDVTTQFLRRRVRGRLDSGLEIEMVRHEGLSVTLSLAPTVKQSDSLKSDYRLVKERYKGFQESRSEDETGRHLTLRQSQP